MKYNKIKYLKLFILTLLIFIIATTSTLLAMYIIDIYNNEALTNDLKDEIITNTNIANPDNPKETINIYSNLIKENDDFIGWLTIPDTIIDYPVMQTKDDEQYYIRRNFNKEYDPSGTLFCSAASDLATPSDNIVIYGHHMKLGNMFQILEKYEKEEFYKEHKYINFNTIYSDNTIEHTYAIIAAYRTDVNEGTYKYYDFSTGTEEEFDEYVNNAVSLTPYNINTKATYGDKLITLSTCAYHTINGRFVVVAKQID